MFSEYLKATQILVYLPVTLSPRNRVFLQIDFRDENSLLLWINECPPSMERGRGTMEVGGSAPSPLQKGSCSDSLGSWAPISPFSPTTNFCCCLLVGWGVVCLFILISSFMLKALNKWLIYLKVSKCEALKFVWKFYVWQDFVAWRVSPWPLYVHAGGGLHFFSVFTTSLLLFQKRWMKDPGGQSAVVN